MKRTLKTYKLEMKVLGPVFIGSGNELKKKEYILTQWYSSICNEGDNEVTIFIDDIVFEYLKLYVLNKV